MCTDAMSYEGVEDCVDGGLDVPLDFRIPFRGGGFQVELAPLAGGDPVPGAVEPFPPDGFRLDLPYRQWFVPLAPLDPDTPYLVRVTSVDEPPVPLDELRFQTGSASALPPLEPLLLAVRAAEWRVPEGWNQCWGWPPTQVRSVELDLELLDQGPWSWVEVRDGSVQWVERWDGVGGLRQLAFDQWATDPPSDCFVVTARNAAGLEASSAELCVEGVEPIAPAIQAIEVDCGATPIGTVTLPEEPEETGHTADTGTDTGLPAPVPEPPAETAESGCRCDSTPGPPLVLLGLAVLAISRRQSPALRSTPRPRRDLLPLAIFREKR